MREIETEKEKKYLVEMNKTQMRTIQLACEAFSRLATAQLHIAIDTAWSHKRFNLSQEKRAAMMEHMKNISLILSGGEMNGWNSSYGISNHEIHPKASTSYNILQVINNFFWKQEPENEKRHHTVDSSVSIINGEEPITINEIKGDGELLIR